jgi:hypothetical protein
VKSEKNGILDIEADIGGLLWHQKCDIPPQKRNGCFARSKATVLKPQK